jgi:hypothetical protein
MRFTRLIAALRVALVQADSLILRVSPHGTVQTEAPIQSAITHLKQQSETAKSATTRLWPVRLRPSSAG